MGSPRGTRLGHGEGQQSPRVPSASPGTSGICFPASTALPSPVNMLGMYAHVWLAELADALQNQTTLHGARQPLPYGASAE